jgi:hypothetical protein
MTPALHQLSSTLRLQLRNRMGMIYGYIFPTIFLVSFWVLYRYEPVPLIRHLGELLTVTALGGACFGLPTTMVSERERGVWRRYRLAPVGTGTLVGSTVVARYLLLLSAALLQLLLAMAIGMPLPEHPLDLFVAFTFVAFAFLGLGLVIAMLADNVPAVQALGQSIFLPMLIIGGVAVRLDSLPEWAQHLSAFFPGRYAVEALQRSATGEGLREAGFALLALTLIGAAGCLAAAKMFRWDARERFVSRGGKGWIAVALGTWVVVGVLGESTGSVAVARGEEGEGVRPPAALGRSDAATDSLRRPPLALSPADSAADPAAAPDTARATPPALAARGAGGDTTGAATDTAGAASRSGPESVPATPPRTPAPWESITRAHIDALDFSKLPPDAGVVAPIAGRNDLLPYPELADELECLRTELLRWPPATVTDPVQRARNLLLVAAVPDATQMEWLEPWAPLEVFEYLQADIHEPHLSKILYWIIVHPNEGDDSAADQLLPLCIDVQGHSADTELLRERVGLYAMKLLGRITGHIE